MATQNNIIDQVFPESLRILSDLIKFQTVSGTSNLGLIEYCEKKLEVVDLDTSQWFMLFLNHFQLFETGVPKRLYHLFQLLPE